MPLFVHQLSRQLVYTRPGKEVHSARQVLPLGGGRGEAMRRLSLSSTTPVKIQGTLVITSLKSPNLHDDTAFMILLGRKRNNKSTGVKWPSKGVVFFNEALVFDATIYRTKKSYQPKTFELQVRPPTPQRPAHDTHALSCKLPPAGWSSSSPTLFLCVLWLPRFERNLD